jgi:hypothetical protein
MTHPREPLAEAALAEVLAAELTKWDDRTLDYAVSHLYGAWPENENLDRDAFIRELLWYIKHRDERENESLHLASVLADHFTEAVTEARAAERLLLEYADSLPDWRDFSKREIRAWLRARADSLAPEAPSQRVPSDAATVQGVIDKRLGLNAPEAPSEVQR